jgi:UPF0042 nucleotide-binding protein
MKLFIVSGTSGSGKSIALHALEDLGYYCIDNLPVGLLPAFVQELQGAERQGYSNAAVGVDARNLANDFSILPEALRQLRESGMPYQILFMDADDDTLFKRFSETRRRHPLTRGDTPLAEAIRRERALLEPIASRADLRLDTSHTNVHQLRDLVQAHVGASTEGKLSLLFESFGYKHGIPVDADFVFDIRCLPNPHWKPSLRALTGRDADVIHFLEQQPEVERMFQSISGFIATWLPQFENDNRSYLTVAIGCTGGQHRSVYFAERLARHFSGGAAKVSVRHRELS